MEKTLRVLGGDESTSHSHSHSHTVERSDAQASGASHTISQNGLRSRLPEKVNGVDPPKIEDRNPTTSPSKLSAYLNLFGDFVHNMSVPRFSSF